MKLWCKKKEFSRIINTILLMVLGVLLNELGAQPAFPGAQGGGAVTVGGRGGIVVEVTNLNDSGPGSFREAVEGAEPWGRRTVVFKVGGTITVKSVIRMKSYITVAGQTAPGDGIMLRSDPDITNPPLYLDDCHDIIFRYFKIRSGMMANRPAGDCIALVDNVYNIIFDHCSFSWSIDENVTMWSKTTSGAGHNYTVQWCISSEGLNYEHHSCGLIIGGATPEVADNMKDFSVHHNLFAHNRNRNPLLKCKTGDIINNLIYNWEWWPTGIAGGVYLDIIGNKYVKGANSSDRGEICWLETTNDLPGANWGPNGDPSIYFEQNIGPHNSEPDSSDRAWVTMTERTHWWVYPDGGRQSLPAEYRRYEPRQLTYPITLNNVLTLEDTLLTENGVGASMHINAEGKWECNRDTVDRRIIKSYLTKTGTIPDNVDDAGGFPDLADGTPYTDNDHDGMADVWEVKYGLDTTNSDDRNDKNLSNEGYTNLEVFLNGSEVVTDIQENSKIIPEYYILKQNYPNPFNPLTTIEYRISTARMTNLSVYNVLGEKVAELVNDKKPAGNYMVKFNASDLPSGVYIYIIKAGNFESIKKMVLIK